MSWRSAANSDYELPLSNPNLKPLCTHLHPCPTSHRQWSASMPHLHTETDSDDAGSIDIEVVSPGIHSQNSLHIPQNLQPFSYEPHFDTAHSSTQYYQTVFEIPASLTLTNTHDGECSLSEHPTATRYIRPVFPTETQRYTARTRLSKMKTNLTFPPINLDYSKPSPPDGWVRYAHPEGARYFYNESLGIFTESEIYDPEILEQLQADYAQLKAISGTFENPFPPTGEFVINVYREKKSQEELTAADKTESTEKLSSEYYCVDHATRLIFFLKESRSDWMEAWHEIDGVRSAFQYQIELLAHYWFFVQLHPSAIELKEDMFLITYATKCSLIFKLNTDVTTSPYSTACYPLDTLYSILSLTRELERNLGHGSMCTLARHMYIFNHVRFLNFHGESCARLERDFSVYDERATIHRTLLNTALSFVLLSAPEGHLRRLQRLWVDGLVHKSAWDNVAKQLNEEWQEFATVALIANVAFLGIQSVGVNVNSDQSPARISSYLSIAANIAVIIIGVVLIRQNREKPFETAGDLQILMADQGYGLQRLAVLYSLPCALAMWAMVAFLAAFVLAWFKNSNVITRAIVGSFCAAIAILTVWCIYTSWIWVKRPIEISTAERPLVYMGPSDPCEEVIDKEEEVHGENTEGHGRNVRHSVLMAIRRFLKFPNPFKPLLMEGNV
ncbi:hypothetical protein D9619_007315 [Psilocybe cf. subviscida]|uniref:WW domain-containing protein n=1 Tax=Psilocybe cf. subviscida TaxID=2480587 RepID=A0A8H5EWY5_9AGAR|nr:hypothetical protein D9619_007315 [Psilocybe cf. subviscida]